jgi:hypothetical protein
MCGANKSLESNFEGVPFGICERDGRILIKEPPTGPMDRDTALELAAWIVVLCDNRGPLYDARARLDQLIDKIEADAG